MSRKLTKPKDRRRLPTPAEPAPTMPLPARRRTVLGANTVRAQALQTKAREAFLKRILKDQQQFYDLVWELLRESDSKEAHNTSRVRLACAILDKLIPTQREFSDAAPPQQMPVLIQVNGLGLQPATVTPAPLPALPTVTIQSPPR